MFHKLTDAVAEQIKTAFAGVEIKEIGTEYTMVISKEIPDRDGDVVVLSGMDMTNYKKNPVVLIDHDYCVESIVGKTNSIIQQDNTLVARFVFADTEYGQLAKKLYDDGFLKTSSIGFILRERDPNDRSRITKWELLEWSLVAVPCNPGAVSLDGKEYKKALEFGLIKSEDAPETTEEVTEEQADEVSEVKALIAEVKEMLEEVKTIVKTLSDRKEQDDTEAEKALAQKELLQTINRHTAQALASMKQLKK